MPKMSPQGFRSPLYTNVPTFSVNRLKAACAARNFSHSQLHIELALAGVTRSRVQIYKWFNHRCDPRASEIGALAVVLRVPVEYFFEMLGQLGTKDA